MVGAKGCHDDFAAVLIFIFNVVAVLFALLGLAGISSIWYTQANPKPEDPVLNVFIPEIMAVFGVGVFLCVFVIAIALLGIITTCIGLKISAAEEKRTKKGKKRKCYHNAGLLVYIGLALFAFFFMLVVGILSGQYSGKLNFVNYVSKTERIKDSWINALERQVSNSVYKMGKDHPKSWNTTQNALGCCGWNITDAASTNVSYTYNNIAGKKLRETTTTRSFNHADVTVYTKDSKCCKGKPVVKNPTAKTGIKLDERNCWVTSDDKGVYTCQGMVAKHMQDNMIKYCIFAIIFALVQLTLAIAGCVVRFPRVFSCCACTGKDNPPKTNKVTAAPRKTNQVQAL